jgi:hypothetical protein
MAATKQIAVIKDPLRLRKDDGIRRTSMVSKRAEPNPITMTSNGEGIGRMNMTTTVGISKRATLFCCLLFSRCRTLPASRALAISMSRSSDIFMASPFSVFDTPMPNKWLCGFGCHPVAGLEGGNCVTRTRSLPLSLVSSMPDWACQASRSVLLRLHIRLWSMIGNMLGAIHAPWPPTSSRSRRRGTGVASSTQRGGSRRIGHGEEGRRLPWPRARQVVVLAVPRG